MSVFYINSACMLRSKARDVRAFFLSALDSAMTIALSRSLLIMALSVLPAHRPMFIQGVGCHKVLNVCLYGT